MPRGGKFTASPLTAQCIAVTTMADNFENCQTPHDLCMQAGKRIDGIDDQMKGTPPIESASTRLSPTASLILGSPGRKRSA